MAHPISKVFVIGFHRTGTRSVTCALQQLGYDIIHYPNPDTNELTLSEFVHGPQTWRILSMCDGLADIVTVPYYQQLAELYPNARFILTTRDHAGWIASVNKHLSRVYALDQSVERKRFDAVVRDLVYNCDRDDESRVRRFKEYEADVIRSLGHRVLHFNINDGWSPLCCFLAADDPPLPFPFAK